MKSSIHQEDIANSKFDAPNNVASKHIKYKLTELKRQNG